MHRHSHNHNHSQGSLPRGRPVIPEEGAKASDCFEQFLTASTLKTILGSYRNICEYLHLKPNVFPLFYPKLKAHINSWKAKPLWKKFDLRANQKCYSRGKACPHTRVLIIGAGPCGLRTAIEAQLLGAKVVVVEKRDRMSRNNVLHLWPFVIDDLRALGAKKFFGKFCAGAIDHISIRQLQCILLKVALLLGVEVHTEVSFERIIEPNPNEKTGWRAEFKPFDHPVSQFEFDVIIGADGKRNTLQGFKRKEFRGKLAIAITANFINKRTEAEARVEEISGVAFIFNQKFFKDLYAETGIDLENIVYYKDDTHYFVMTAKKQSLIDKAVIREDLSDTAKLLAPDNVDREELMNYAREAAEFSTNYQMTDLEFAVNHYGQPDVAMFDFTSMYAAENASRVTERHNYKLLSILVGDSLLEPFWPTGSGCARGFLSSMDAAWAIRSWGSDISIPLEVIAERESIYRLLAQTTPENLNKDYKSYTLDPSSRYPNLNKNALLPHQVTNLYDTDDPKSIELIPRPAPTVTEVPKKRRRRESHVDPDTLLNWIKEQIREHDDIEVVNITTSFIDGRILCAIISHYRPDLLDYSAINAHDFSRNNQVAFDILEKELGIPPIMTGEEMANTDSPDFSTMLSYLTKIYDTFRGEIPHIKYPKWDEPLRITRTSAVVVPSSNYHLRPLLITPRSSAKVSDTEYLLSSPTLTESYILPTPPIPKTENNLILVPVKSIENYLSESKTMNKCESKSNTQQGKMSDPNEFIEKFHPNSNPPEFKVSKSDSLFAPVRKSKSKVSINCSKLQIGKRNSTKSINSKQMCEPKKRRKRINRRIIDTIANKDSDKSVSAFDYSGDHTSSSGKQINNAASRITSVQHRNNAKINLKIEPSSKKKGYFTRKGNKYLPSLEVQRKKILEKNNVNNRLLEDNNSNETQSSMAGSAQLTLNFLREMNSFLHKHSQASEELNAVKNNVEVKIRPPKYTLDYPSREIPSALLDENSNDSNDPDIVIKNIERRSSSTVAIQVVKFFSISNYLSIIPKLISNVSSSLNLNFFRTGNRDCLDKTNIRESCQRKISPDESLAKVEGWIKSSNFENDDASVCTDVLKVAKNVDDNETVILSIAKDELDRRNKYSANSSDNNKIPNSSTVNSYESAESMSKFVETLKTSNAIKGVAKINNTSPWEIYEGRAKSKSEPPDQFSTIIEGEESDMPEPKRNENVLKVHTAGEYVKAEILSTIQPPRPSSRHKRHVDTGFLSKVNAGLSQDRKARKRKTLEKVGASVEDRQKRYEEIVSNRVDRQNKRRHQRKMQTEQFIKSMQMLQSNCKPDHSEPFEDYSIFLYRQTAPNFEDRVKHLEKQFIYVPDKESRVIPAQMKRETDEDFAARIKDIEEKWREPVPVEKKPKDLLRAIGKIETSDWNIKEIEKKMIENKMGKAVNKDKEKVPKWSREQFLARQTKMERQHLDRQNSAEVKFAEIDKNIKQLEQKLKEGSVRDVGQHKVATITEKLVGKSSEAATAPETKPVEKSNPRAVIPINQGSDFCHFCSKRVYLVERLSAEGKVFHTGCFRCQYCHISLRLGSYMFDREGVYGHRFYCTQHYGMPGEVETIRPEKKLLDLQETSQKKLSSNVIGVDLLDRVQTPERIEFSNLSTGHVSSDHDESPSPIDEDEWTDRNNINSVIDSDSSDDSSSSSDTDTDDETYEEALEEPITKEGTLRWAERYKKRYSHKDDDSDSGGYSSSDHFSYYENSSGDDDSDTATEGEEEIRARELRKQEVRVEPPIDAGTDTEVASCDTTSESSSEIQNSATEISTDSEFAHDDPTPTREVPKKIFDDFVTKTRGNFGQPKKVQVKSGVLQQPINGRLQTKDIELKFTPLVSTPILRKPAPSSLFARNEGYALNRTQSTGGIATKVSLELKKKYLLGETNPTGGIQKSGSASTLDSKFKSFHTNITDCQKLLKPAPEISASMQLFCDKLSERTSPLSPVFGLPALYGNERSSITNLSAEQNNKQNSVQLSKFDISKCMSTSSIPEIIEATVINELEGRPRSPVHEKQIVVPIIDWFKAKQDKERDFVDSLSSDSESEENVIAKPNIISNIPRLEVHDDSGAILNDHDDMAYDSLNGSINYHGRHSINDVGKSITSEKKTLNQPKTLPGMSSDSVLPDYHSALHIKQKSDDSITNKDVDNRSTKDSSGRSTPSLNDDVVTNILTETELDDFEDVEYELVSEINALNSSNEEIKRTPTKILTTDPQDYLNDTCKAEKGKVSQASTAITECVNILNLNIDNIEFMDTGTETSSDDNIALKNNGYVQFHNEDEFAEDSLSPAINVVETVNPSIKTAKINIDEIKNKMSSQSDSNFVDNVKLDHSACDPRQLDSNNKLNMKHVCDNEDDSILVLETGTTTEENTCSDSTVKNITERIPDDQPQIHANSVNAEADVVQSVGGTDFAMQRTLDNTISTNDTTEHEDFTEFREHCQRLQSKIEFSNVKDSIDIRKTRRKSKPDITKPDLIQEEKEKMNPPLQPESNITPIKLSKREEIEKERNINQKLVQEMVMTKMRAQNKSLERKKRTRNSFSPIRPFELSKSATIDLSPRTTDVQTLQSPTPDVLLSTIHTPLQKSQSSILVSSENDIPEPVATSSQLQSKCVETVTHNLPDISKLNDDVFLTPKQPPRIENEDARKTAEKFKQNARARCRLLSDEDLGLSPEDKLIKLRQKALRKARDPEHIDIHVQDSIESLVINTERRNSLLYSNDTLKRNTSFRRSKSGDASISTPNNLQLVSKLSIKDTDKISPPIRTKSVSEISKFTNMSNVDFNKENADVNICKSDPNLLIENKKPTKKHKDRERRKSITKMITELFSKKKENTANVISKGFLSRISPKSKNKSKSWFDLDLGKIEKAMEESILRRNSISEVNLRRDIDGNISPPPIPPLPINYVRRHSLKDDSSDAENDHRQDLGSCETLDQSEIHAESISNYNGRKLNRNTRKTARQAQLKRHRMAQEIQRKLEESEVKTRELEHRGVQVEKALRGESNGSEYDENKDESELLKEWFDLMRDRTELRRYEKELMIRAQELELEDRHARLQHELRERLENNEPKTKEEMELEGGIIKEMMDIVAKRDSLINLLEEDRLRYFEEDRDFEEQILAKGIHLTPLLKPLDNK